MNTSLSYQERQAWATRAMEGVSDEALQKLTKEGGVRTLIKGLHERTSEIGKGVETLGALALLAQAYMNERFVAHDRKQQGLPSFQRSRLTLAELYPEGFSMEKAKEEFKSLRSASPNIESLDTEPTVEVSSEPATATSNETLVLSSARRSCRP